MKKILTIGTIMFILPFATFAHGGEFADADEQTATKKEMQMEQQNHEQMENLMKEFLVNGTLSQEDAQTVVTLMGNKMSGSKMSGSKMGMSSVDSDNMMGGSADHDGGMMGGSNMMSMNLLHALVGVTSTVWLIAGIMYLANIRRQTSVRTSHE